MASNDVSGHERGSIDAETIVQVAAHLFRDLGYQKTTVREIAEKLAISPANIYRFFHSKEDLRRAVFVRILDASYAKTLEISNLPIDAASRLRRRLLLNYSVTIDVIDNNPRIHDLLLRGLDRYHDVLDSHFERMCDITAKVIADGMKEGEFARQDVQEASRVFMLVTAPLWHPALLLQQAATRNCSNPEAVIDFALHALKR